jgi:hypothetical protein
MLTRESRDLLRIAVPPVLALGLVALLVRPMEPLPAPVLPPSVSVVAPSAP